MTARLCIGFSTRLLLALLILLVLGGPPLAAARAAPCEVAGFIFSDTTWSPSLCDPYVVTGNIIVNTGAALTIEPGTTVKFDSLTAITVNGMLVARGGVSSAITFTSNLPTPAKGDWGYIYFSDSSADARFDANGNYVGGSIIESAVIEYAGGVGVNDNGAVRIQASSPYINQNTIRHNDADGVHVWGNGEPRITDNTVTNNGTTGFVSAEGIYVKSSGKLTITGNSVSNNTSTGIYCDCTDANLTVTGNRVTENVGSGIYAANGITITISNNTLSGNTASYGGGIYTYYGDSVTITNNAISDNSTSSSGGGIYASYGGDVMISHNTISGNSASGSGGGIYTYSYNGGLMTISDNTISDNSSSSSGGGIYASYGFEVAISNNTIAGNSATSSGGGIYAYYGDSVTIGGNSISDNSASSSGGGIYISSADHAAIGDNIISGNSASYGGGIYDASSGVETVGGNTITLNTASQANQGGGIFLCSGCRPAISNNNLLGNLTGDPLTVLNELYNGNSSGSPDVNAENNYWGATETSTIEDRIWHFIDNAVLGVVDYTPYLTRSTGSNILINPGFESGPDVGWTEFSSTGREVITIGLPRAGAYSAHECGYDDCTEYIEQTIYVPDGAKLRYWWYMNSDEDTVTANDFLKVELYRLDGTLLRTVRTWDNTATRDTWVQDTINLAGAARRTVQLRFTTTTNGTLPTSFYVDDLLLR